jgi:hypothetical protein
LYPCQLIQDNLKIIISRFYTYSNDLHAAKGEFLYFSRLYTARKICDPRVNVKVVLHLSQNVERTKQLDQLQCTRNPKTRNIGYNKKHNDGYQYSIKSITKNLHEKLKKKKSTPKLSKCLINRKMETKICYRSTRE